MNRTDILKEVLAKYKNSPVDFEWWLKDQIEPSNVLPSLQAGEIQWWYCTQCGNNFLSREAHEIIGARPVDNGNIVPAEIKAGEKCHCGNDSYIQLGTNQGKIWKERFLK